MDKDSKEALQVAKELTAKFIETRTVTPGNFADIFPAIYNVVASAIARSGQCACQKKAAPDEPATCEQASSDNASAKCAGEQKAMW